MKLTKEETIEYLKLDYWTLMVLNQDKEWLNTNEFELLLDEDVPEYSETCYYNEKEKEWICGIKRYKEVIILKREKKLNDLVI